MSPSSQRSEEDGGDMSSNSSKDTEKTLTEDDDPALDPRNWPASKKVRILTIAVALVVNSTLDTALATGNVKATIKDFGLTADYGWKVLPVSVFLVGYFIGNATLAPLSENYGRRSINLVTTFGSMIWIMACALAPNWAAFNVFRFLNGFLAAGPPSTTTGICSDLYEGDLRRGRALLAYNMASTGGSVLGPIISGWAVMDSWRLTYWIGLGLSGLCFLACFFGAPETNMKIVIARRAKKLRDDKGEEIYAADEKQPFDLHQLFTKILLRPTSMLFTEPIVSFTCLYIGFLYAIFFIFLQSFPIIFTDIYGFNTGEEGLAFLGIGAGILLAVPTLYLFEHIYIRACSQNKAWTKHPGARRLPPACASGPLIVLSLFWSAWTSKASIHWISSVLSGVPYGLGYVLNFNALINYLTDNYTAYASSANAASSLSRQIMGAAVPFAAVPMYRALGVGWASSLLGFVSAGMAVIPFIFWMYGERMLKKSKWAQELAEE